MSLPRCETNDFLNKDQIREKEFALQAQEIMPNATMSQTQKLNYAKQKALLQGIDIKLNYFNLQKERHPYIKELREYAAA